MTETQLARWKQFSLGLARHAYPFITDARRKKLIRAVDDCISWIVCNGLDTVIGWDDAPRDEKGRDIEDCIGTRADQYLWDHRYIREKCDRRGNCDVEYGDFGTMLLCCVRAGCDVAVEPSGGVVGYTVGDVRKIFDDQLPDWVREFFGNPPDLDTADGRAGVWL